MPHDLPKAYDPTAIEDHWADYWVREKLFDRSDARPPPSKTKARPARPFTILLPPPNVTGRLHMGHMLNQTEMDILTRWRRMSGRLALWVPGTDHAGIATQMMVERQLAEEGTSRQKLGREAFVERVWKWRRALRRRDSRADEAPRRLRRLEPRILHHGRAAFGGGARGLRAPLPPGPHLSRRLHRELVPALPDRDQRPRGGAPGAEGPPVGDPVPGARRRRQGDGRVHHRGDDAPGDDARRHGGGHSSRGRALSASARQKAAPAADGSRDSHRGRSLGEPRVRHRRGEGDAGARSQRLRARRAAPSAFDQRDGRSRAHQRGGRRRTLGSTATSRARRSLPTSKRRGCWPRSRITPTTWATATAAKPWSSRGSPRSGSWR